MGRAGLDRWGNSFWVTGDVDAFDLGLYFGISLDARFGTAGKPAVAPGDPMKMKHNYSLDNDWPFPDPPNVAVFTTISVLNRSAPIVLITHDEEDGAWQFHSASEVGSPEDYVRIVSLKRIVELDPTVVQVAGLARGWIAERLANGGGWKKYRRGIRQ